MRKDTRVEWYHFQQDWPTGTLRVDFQSFQQNLLSFWLRALSKAPMPHPTNMATFVIPRHPVTTLITAFTDPDNLTNDHLILKVDCVTLLLQRALKQSERRT